MSAFGKSLPANMQQYQSGSCAFQNGLRRDMGIGGNACKIRRAVPIRRKRPALKRPEKPRGLQFARHAFRLAQTLQTRAYNPLPRIYGQYQFDHARLAAHKARNDSSYQSRRIVLPAQTRLRINAMQLDGVFLAGRRPPEQLRDKRALPRQNKRFFAYARMRRDSREKPCKVSLRLAPGTQAAVFQLSIAHRKIFADIQDRHIGSGQQRPERHSNYGCQ